MVQRVCIGEKGKVVTVLLKLRDSTAKHNMWEVEHWYTNTHTAQGGLWYVADWLRLLMTATGPND